MKCQNQYDAIIVTTAADLQRVYGNIPRLIHNLPAEKIIFVGNTEVGELVAKIDRGNNVGFINEDDIIPFADVHAVMKEVLECDNVPRGITGWYYQQFLKMSYCRFSEHKYYLVWDGDTVPCSRFEMISEDGVPYFDMKHEYHKPYFDTMNELLGITKNSDKSFISEHMLIDCDIMRELIAAIETNGTTGCLDYYKKILMTVGKNRLISNSFSEFETYGTYCILKHNGAYRLRDWHSLRYGSMYFIPDKMSQDDYDWLSVDFDAVSFEKNQDYEPGFAALFSDGTYRQKLSARQILEAIQAEATEGMNEIWEDKTPLNDYDEIKKKLLEDDDFLAAMSDNLAKMPAIVGDASRVHLSENVNLNNTLLNTMSGHISIGPYTFMGQNVSLVTGSHDISATGSERMNFYGDNHDITIGAGVWLCQNVTVLGPSRIDSDSVVAAGSVVLPGTHIGRGELWAGVPACKKKDIDFKSKL